MFGTCCRRRGSAASIVVVVLVLVLLAGGLWYFVFRSTPEKTVTNLLQAARRGDEERMAAYLTEGSRVEGNPIVGLTRHMAGEAEGEPQYTVGEREVTEERAVVPVEFPVSGTISTLTGMESLTVPYVLHREGRTWLVDTSDTQQEIANRIAGGAWDMVRRFIMRGGPMDEQEPGERNI